MNRRDRRKILVSSKPIPPPAHRANRYLEESEYKDILANAGISYDLSQSPELQDIIKHFIAALDVFRDSEEPILEKLKIFFNIHTRDIFCYKAVNFASFHWNLHPIATPANIEKKVKAELQPGDIVLIREDSTEPGVYDVQFLRHMLDTDESRWYKITTEDYKALRPNLTPQALSKKTFALTQQALNNYRRTRPAHES